jgi:1-acyl-sn-glycerol-3-phosphate acyltransferase
MSSDDIPYLPQRPADRVVAFALALLAPLVIAFVVFHVLWGMLVAGLMFPWLPARVRDALLRFWSRILLAAMGVRLETRGWPAPSGPEGSTGALLLLNHVSWIDVFVVAAVVPARFVAKREIRAWPLLGWLSEAVGTLFIERGRRHAVAHVNRHVAERLRSGQSVGIFPEGTTTDGTTLLPFHSNLVQSALLAGAPVVPVALQYRQDDEPSVAAAYVGEMSLGESILRILIAPRLRVVADFLPPLQIAPGETRQAIARQARQAISAALALPVQEAAGEPLSIGAAEPTSTGG